MEGRFCQMRRGALEILFAQMKHTIDASDLANNKSWLSSWGVVPCQALRGYRDIDTNQILESKKMQITPTRVAPMTFQ